MLSRSGFRVAMGALAIASVLAATNASAEDRKSVINAATTTYYVPFAFKDPASNKLTGFNVGLVEAAAGKMGTKVN
ncbi:ABC-type amino acid transport substrate-binding protein [Bradyrhizobium japonicum]